MLMTALLSTLGEVVTTVLSYIGTICATIVDQPILLITLGIMVLGAACGILGRLIARG